MAQADHAWATWCRQDPALAVATDTATLRSWLKQSAAADADTVLLGLARLAAPDGGDDYAAAAALAWAMLPAACTLAHRLRTLSPSIDQVVASQLWLEVRSFPWRRLTKVSSNIVLNTRAGVLRECDAPSQLKRSDPTWSRTSPVDPYGPFWARMSASEVGAADAATELFELLDWACDRDVITAADRRMLLRLLEAGDRLRSRRTGRCGAGLMANETTEHVARQLGMSARTLRRRARRSIDALADACGNGQALA
ncbi:hypothetical protein [Allobranchiibius sp. GilTou38]|uniref:hypothetical protein n=1 Tax=Allobranchiibius sp. GilTou38 TaxID=2815210 RepID=UPI001AA0D88C|nr:hypothetical protein [Allobranchiibius sp. GilTou38]MBO1766675.1 hypothetical protein [Allobranchiibius sp. GilTou38]